MDENLSSLLAEAKEAIAKGDPDTAIGLLDRILEQDLTHAEAWRLMHQELGEGQPLIAFQSEYVKSFYPERAHLFVPDAPLPRTAKIKAETAEDWIYLEDVPEQPAGRRKKKDSLRRITLPRDQEQASQNNRPQKSGLPRPKTGPIPKTKRIKTEPRPAKEKAARKAGGPSLRARLSAITPGFLKRLFSRQPSEKKTRPAPGWLDRPIFRFLKRRQVVEEVTEQPVFVKVPSPSPKPKNAARANSLLTTAKKLEEKSKKTREKDGSDGAFSLKTVSKIGAIKVLVVDDVPETRENLQKLLLLEPNVDVVGLATTGKHGVKLAVQQEPDVILMDINMPDMDGLEATRQIKEQVPFAQVIMLTVQDDPVYMREALRSGARDFLIKPPGIDDLFSAIHQAHHFKTVELGRQEKLHPEAFRDPRDIMRAPGRIVSVFSPKGGVGCTTLASNLAVSLHSDDTRTVLVDGQLRYGNAALFFNEQGRTSIADLATRVEELDPAFVREVAIPHVVSGVSIIPAPEQPAAAKGVAPEQLTALLTYLQSMYAYVIVDLGSVLDNWNLAMLDTSDQIFLVLTQDIPAINDARRFLELAPRIGIPDNRISLVLTQFHRRINIEPERIGEILKKEISCVVPLDSRIVIPAVNRGMPFMTNTRAKSSPIGQALLEMARIVREGAMAVEG